MSAPTKPVRANVRSDGLYELLDGSGTVMTKEQYESYCASFISTPTPRAAARGAVVSMADLSPAPREAARPAPRAEAKAEVRPAGKVETVSMADIDPSAPRAIKPAAPRGRLGMRIVREEAVAPEVTAAPADENRKYRILSNGTIQALKDLPNGVRSGEHGGVVENAMQLAQAGSCWVMPGVKLKGSTRITGDIVCCGKNQEIVDSVVSGVGIVNASLRSAKISGHVFIDAEPARQEIDNQYSIENAEVKGEGLVLNVAGLGLSLAEYNLEGAGEILASDTGMRVSPFVVAREEKAFVREGFAIRSNTLANATALIEAFLSPAEVAGVDEDEPTAEEAP